MILEKLDNVNYLIKRVAPYQQQVITYNFMEKLGEMYCPTCRADSRMDVWALNINGSIAGVLVFQAAHPPLAESTPELEDLPPSLFNFNCVNCKTRFAVVLHLDRHGTTLAIFPSCAGGFSSPHTPSNVSYYTDQAYKSYCGGAYLAVAAMQRSALSQLLEQQGFSGKLPAQLRSMEEAVKNSTAPKWCAIVPAEILATMKELGNMSLHASDDHAALESIEREDATVMLESFGYLLHLVYEEEWEEKDHLDRVRDVLKKLK